MELRPYQKESIAELSKGFANKHKRQILALTTGAGKTVVFSQMVKQAAEKGTNTMIFTDRVELFAQTFKTLECKGIKAQIINAKTKHIDNNALITIAMIETIKRRKHDLKPKLIIIDEAHRGNFTKLFDIFPDAYVIGATATPIGTHIPKYYTNIVQTIDTPDLIQQGFLSSYIGYQMQDDFSDLKIKGSDYSEESLFNHYHQRKQYDGVIEQYIKHVNGKKTIVFNVNIAHTEAMTQEFNNAGIESYCVTSKTPPAERERILRAFTLGMFPVLNNCGILTTGYDEPSIECVIMNRKTLSLPLWLQCCGRGSRIYPNKKNFIVLDFGMNHSVHGMWDEPRQWTLKEKKKKKQAAPTKDCPECDALNYASARFCKACNYEFEIKNGTELQQGVMVQMIPTKLLGKKISQLSLEELKELQIRKKYKASFIWRVVRNRGRIAVKSYAELMGYSEGWVYRQLEDLVNSSFKDYVIK